MSRKWVRQQQHVLDQTQINRLAWSLTPPLIRKQEHSYTQTHTLAHSYPIKMSTRYFPCIGKAGTAAAGSESLVWNFNLRPRNQDFNFSQPGRMSSNRQVNKTCYSFWNRSFSNILRQKCTRDPFSLSNCLVLPCWYVWDIFVFLWVLMSQSCS